MPRYSKLVRNTEAIIWNAPTATKPSLKLEDTTQTASQQLVKAIELTKHTPSLAHTPTRVGKKYGYLQEKSDTSCHYQV